MFESHDGFDDVRSGRSRSEAGLNDVGSGRSHSEAFCGLLGVGGVLVEAAPISSGIKLRTLLGLWSKLA